MFDVRYFFKAVFLGMVGGILKIQDSRPDPVGSG